MIHSTSTVYLYIFDSNEERKPQERLQFAVLDYCQAVGLKKMPDEKTGQQIATDALLENLRIERTPEGKPYFPDCPMIQFSISHSGKFWACAISQEAVGMDLQEHTRLQNETVKEASARFLKMARRFFHPAEAAFIEEDSYRNFFTVWSAKEAYVKYTGQGIDPYFSELCVAPITKERWSAMGTYFLTMEYQENYTLCVCTEKEVAYKIVECY